MKGPTLTLRICRRAIGAAVLSGNELSFVDGRHLRSTASRAVPMALRYLNRVVELTQPKSIVIDASPEVGSTTDQIVSTLLKDPIGKLPIEVLPTAHLLVAFGMPALRSRTELRATAAQMFPQLAAMSLSAKPYLLDASAAALYVESTAALGTPI